jgi:hypothetical protein
MKVTILSGDEASEQAGAVFRVTDIREADYGCEERPDDVGPVALVYLEPQDAGQERFTREIPEAVLAAEKIDVGSIVKFEKDGKIKLV